MEEKRPTVLKVGKRKAKEIKDLKKGEGKLMDKVKNAVAQAGAVAGKEVVPVVIIYRKKARKTKRGLAMLSPF
jgi:hypothetical protein